MRVLPMLDVSSFTPPPRLVAAISAYCAAEHGRANELLGIAVPFESEEGQGVLAEMVAAHWSDLTDLAALVRDIVALEPACLVLRGLGYNQYPETVRDSLVLALTQSIGKPTDHNLDKRVLWPVKPRAEAVRRMVDYKTTFSEEAGEAPLHSDSAFAPAPEKYNCLFVVRQATAGGDPATTPMQPQLFQSPLTYFILGLTIGYYLVYRIGLFVHLHDKKQWQQ